MSSQTQPTTSGGSRKRKRSNTEENLSFRIDPPRGDSDEFRLSLQRLFEAGQLCDIHFDVRGESFSAHRVVLAASNSFLGEMVLSGMKESHESETMPISLDVDPTHFNSVLRHIYGFSIEVNSANIVAMLALASSYSIAGLRNRLCEILAGNISVSNCAAIYSTADAFACLSLRKAAENLLASNFAAVSRTEGFLDLSVEMICGVLCSDNITDCDEAVVFEAAVRWLDHKKVDREGLALQILSLVRFPLMDSCFLSDVIKPHPYMSTPDKASLLLEAFEHHALVACGRIGLISDRTRKRHQSCTFTKSTTLNGHSDAISAVICIGDVVVSGSWDNTIKVWSTETWQCVRTLSDHAAAIRGLCVCGERVVSCADDGSIKVWSPGTWTCVRSLEGHSAAVNAVRECRGRLASASDDGTIKLWSPANNWACEVTVHHTRVGVEGDNNAEGEEEEGEEGEREGGHVGVVCMEVFDDKVLVSGCDDNTVRVWNINTWRCECVLRGHEGEVWAIKAFSVDCFITGSVDGKFRIWRKVSHTLSASTSEESEDWQCEQQVETDGPVYDVCCVDGYVVTGGDCRRISIWKPAPERGEDWRLHRWFETEDGGIWALSACKGRLVSGGMDGVVRVWL